MQVQIYDVSSNKIGWKFPSRGNISAKALEGKMISYILSKKEEFKARGSALVLENQTESWQNFVENLLKNPDEVLYNGVCIEASLQCMGALSQGIAMERIYQFMDMGEYFGVKLSDCHRYSVTCLVGFYHERGREFSMYQNDESCQKQDVKQKVIS